MAKAHSRHSALLAAMACVACLTAATFGGEPLDKPKKFDLDSALKAKEPQPVNGVLLKTPKAEVVEQFGQKTLRFDWSIHYDGPRWPLVILEPDLERADYGQTQLLIVALGKSGKAYSVRLRSPRGFRNFPMPEKEWFLTIPDKAKPAKGILAIDLQEAKELFLKHHADEFSAKVVPSLYIRLELHSVERGDEHELDAWTGTVLGPLTKVVAKEW